MARRACAWVTPDSGRWAAVHNGVMGTGIFVITGLFLVLALVVALGLLVLVALPHLRRSRAEDDAHLRPDSRHTSRTDS